MRDIIKSAAFAAVHLAALYGWAMHGNEHLLNLQVFFVWVMLPVCLLLAGSVDMQRKIAATPKQHKSARWINRAWHYPLLGALVAHGHWLTASALLLALALAAATHAAAEKIRAEAASA